MLQMPDTGVAISAEKSADDAGIVAVVNMEVSSWRGAVYPANGAAAFLRGEHPSVLAALHPVVLFATVLRVALRICVVSAKRGGGKLLAVRLLVGDVSDARARLARAVQSIVKVLVASELRFGLGLLTQRAALHAGRGLVARRPLLCGREAGSKARLAVDHIAAVRFAVPIELLKRLQFVTSAASLIHGNPPISTIASVAQVA